MIGAIYLVNIYLNYVERHPIQYYIILPNQPYNNMMNPKSKSKSAKDRESRQKSSLQNLQNLREILRKEAENAVMQVKQNQMLSLDEIRQAEDLFDNIQETNKYLKSRNQYRKKRKEDSIDKHKQSKGKTKKHASSQKDQQVEQKHASVDKDNSVPKNKNKQTKIEKKAHVKQKKMSKDNSQPKQRKVSKDKTQKNPKDKNVQKRRISTVMFDETRKWNEVLPNPKKGKFQPQQKRILAQSMSKYMLDNNIDPATVIQSINSPKQQKIPNNLKMWTTICSVLPNRSLHSTYKYLVRYLTTKKVNEKWNQEEQQKLLALYQRYGSKWMRIGRKMGRTGQNVRDKFRNLSKSHDLKIWKIQQLLTFLKQIEKQTKKTFLKQGIDSLLEQAEQHNKQQLELRQIYKYNSKFMLSHNNVQVLDYIEASALGGVQRNKIRWKDLSDKVKTKNQLECKNKYLQFMEILNRDYRGNEQEIVLKFLKGQADKNKEFGECNIRWHEWDEEETGIKVEQAKCKWMMVKKKIRNRGSKTFQQLLDEALIINERKRGKFEKKSEKLTQKQELRKKRRQERRKKTQEKQNRAFQKKAKSLEQKNKEKQINQEQVMIPSNQPIKHKKIRKPANKSKITGKVTNNQKQKNNQQIDPQAPKQISKSLLSKNGNSILLIDENSYDDKVSSEHPQEKRKQVRLLSQSEDKIYQVEDQQSDHQENHQKPQKRKRINKRRKNSKQVEIKKMNFDFMNKK